jgi:alkylation response protein AidB-like acyl-CoA dehydrogenase
MDDDQLRAEARAWYRSAWDPSLTVGEWYRRMAGSGFGYPAWPTRWWGGGHGGRAARVVREERRRVGALGPPSGIGPTLLAPMLFEHGTDEQCQRFLWGMATQGWTVCQMLSEPDAGSDLAGVRTRAVRDGDEWVVTGSKIWTSNADTVDYGMLLARTDWDAPKHRGLTFFLIPRDQAGVDVRPLRQMTGDARFNEVFFDGARVAAGDVLGAPGDGWAVARTFLAHEKNSYNPDSHEGGLFGRVDLDRPVGEVLEAESHRAAASAQGRGIGRVLADLVASSGRAADPLVRQELAAQQTLRRAMGYTNARARAARRPGSAGGGGGGAGAVRPGVEAASSKLVVSALTRRQRDLGLAVQGPHGQLAGPDAPSAQFQYFSLHSPSLSIAGGTDEIQRNHLAERVLGLPPEPRADTELPFRDLPASGANPPR